MPAALFAMHYALFHRIYLFIICVFQDQNEWQIGPGEINIAGEVRVSRGHQMGGVPERNRSYQGGFCTCLSESPQVTRRETRRESHGIHWKPFAPSSL